MNKLKIFDYTDFREFLREKFEECKKSNPAFSYRYFSKKAGLKSTNFLKLVIKGESNLSVETIHKFAAAFSLGKMETKYFQNLVFF